MATLQAINTLRELLEREPCAQLSTHEVQAIGQLSNEALTRFLGAQCPDNSLLALLTKRLDKAQTQADEAAYSAQTWATLYFTPCAQSGA
jgi:hypothetical protein